MVLLFLIYMYHTDNLGKNLFGTCSVYLIIKITLGKNINYSGIILIIIQGFV
jgi:hypothetical protein